MNAMRTHVEKLNTLLQRGENDVRDLPSYRLWQGRAKTFIATALGTSAESDFTSLGQDTYDDWPERFAMQMGYIEGLTARSEKDGSMIEGTDNRGTQSPITDTRKVFVVHGHDNAAKETVARFLDKLALVPVILHEQPSSGRTIIEKFEVYSEDVGFAVVLLTPDDVGATVNDSGHLRARARQNVIMELGYFMGKLGRTRVCALHKGNVELPSDYQGVLYVQMDEGGAWKLKLAQEMVQSKLPIDVTGLLGG